MLRWSLHRRWLLPPDLQSLFVELCFGLSTNIHSLCYGHGSPDVW